MKLKITSPDKVIFNWEIKAINVPTEAWEIGLLPWHHPITCVVKPWIVKITVRRRDLKELQDMWKFIFDEDECIILSISRWLLYLSNDDIKIVTSSAVRNPRQSEQIMLDMKKDLEKQIQFLKAKWSIDNLEKALIDLDKVNADLKLFKMKWYIKNRK